MALAAVLPRMALSLAAGASGRDAAAGGERRTGNVIGSLSFPSTTLSSSASSLFSPALRGLILVSDSLGADAAFIVAHLLIKCIRDGKKVVLVAAAESGAHYGAVLKKLGLGPGPGAGGGGFHKAAAATGQQQQQQQQPHDRLFVVPLWDDDAFWTHDSTTMSTVNQEEKGMSTADQEEKGTSTTGLRRASEAIRRAVGEADENTSTSDNENDNGDNNDVALVFDSLSALAAAARSEAEWESFVAREVLGSRASCVIARTDCVPSGNGAGGGGDGGRSGGVAGDDDDIVDDIDGGGDLSATGASCAAAPWLSALRSAASVELTTRPLPSGAAVDVSGVLVARRGATAAAAAPLTSSRRRRRERQQQDQELSSLEALSLSSSPSLDAPPPRTTAVFNYRLVDASVRLVPRRTV